MMDTVVITLRRVECCQCHATFALTKDVYDQRCRDHRWFFCAVCGQRQAFFGESDVEEANRLREQAERKLARERARHDQTSAELEHTERRRRAEKAAKTRLKKRFQHGQCPCCDKTFKDLAGHIERQHPEFMGERVAT